VCKEFRVLCDQEDIWRNLFVSSGFVRREEEESDAWRDLFKSRKTIWSSKIEAKYVNEISFQKSGGIRCLDQAESFLVCGCSGGEILVVLTSEIDRCQSSLIFPRFGVLSGHTSWVYSVCAKMNEASGELIIGSCSRDRTVRLSHIARNEYLNLRPDQSGESQSQREVALRFLFYKVYHVWFLVD
jgi:WD40 repeat protein